jgi:chemotaxis family two-component system sensor kinase Cph1
MLANQINQGDHVAFFFKTKEEQLGTVIPFIAIGLEKNEQCLYIADANTPAEIRQQLQAYGVDVEAAKISGALSIVTKHETYLRHGSFEPHKMIIDLCSAVDDSVDDSVAAGFDGLRAAGELSWALDLPSALAQLVEYEERLDSYFYERFTALCQYDEARFPGALVERMKQLHPVVIADGKLRRKSLMTASKIAV